MRLSADTREKGSGWRKEGVQQRKHKSRTTGVIGSRKHERPPRDTKSTPHLPQGNKVKPPMQGPGDFVFLAPFLPTFLTKVLRQNRTLECLNASVGCRAHTLTKAWASLLTGKPKHCPRGDESGNNRPTRAPTREQWRTSHFPRHPAPPPPGVGGVTGQGFSYVLPASPAPLGCPR